MAERRIFFGWHVVGAAFTTAVFAWGIGFYGPPIFLQVLHASRGWPIPLVSAAITTHFLFGAAVIARLATLHQRFGIAFITRLGAVLTALGLLGWAFAQSPWQLFAATLPSGAGWAMTSGAAINAMVAPWFIRRRPAALSMAFNGASMGGVIFSPLWVALIKALGFPVAAALVACALLITLWFVAARYFAATPAGMGLTPDGIADTPLPHARQISATPRLWHDWRFLTLAACASLGFFAQIGLIAQLFSLLVPALGESGAGITMGVTTICAIAGRFGLGAILGPRSDRRFVSAANALVQACGSLTLLLAAGHNAPLLLLGCVLFGLGLGNLVTLPLLIAQAEFAPGDVARVVALITATSQAAYAFAPAAFGALRGIGASHGEAPLLFAAACAIQLAGAVVVLAGRTRPALTRASSPRTNPR